MSSLKHLSHKDGVVEPKYTARQAVESKVGMVPGWEEVLSCTGFHFISQIKKDIPATIVFPDHDDSGLQKKCQRHLEALLGTYMYVRACRSACRHVHVRMYVCLIPYNTYVHVRVSHSPPYSCLHAMPYRAMLCARVIHMCICTYVCLIPPILYNACM